MANKLSELNVEVSEETGAEAGAGKDEAGVDGAAEK